MELTDLPNIGKELALRLIQEGITSPAEFMEIGSQQAFSRIRMSDSNACINMLYAMEGAIQGIRWHDLKKSDKEELHLFFSLLEKS